MSVPEIVELIRDIAIILMAIAVFALSITALVMLLKVFPSLKRGSRNFEMTSRIMLETTARIAGIVNFGSEIANLVTNVVQQIRSRATRREGKEDEGGPET